MPQTTAGSSKSTLCINFSPCYIYCLPCTYSSTKNRVRSVRDVFSVDLQNPDCGRAECLYFRIFESPRGILCQKSRLSAACPLCKKTVLGRLARDTPVLPYVLTLPQEAQSFIVGLTSTSNTTTLACFVRSTGARVRLSVGSLGVVRLL